MAGEGPVGAEYLLGFGVDPNSFDRIQTDLQNGLKGAVEQALDVTVVPSIRGTQEGQEKIPVSLAVESLEGNALHALGKSLERLFDQNKGFDKFHADVSKFEQASRSFADAIQLLNTADVGEGLKHINASVGAIQGLLRSLDGKQVSRLVDQARSRTDLAKATTDERAASIKAEHTAAAKNPFAMIDHARANLSRSPHARRDAHGDVPPRPHTVVRTQDLRGNARVTHRWRTGPLGNPFTTTTLQDIPSSRSRSYEYLDTQSLIRANRQVMGNVERAKTAALDAQRARLLREKGEQENIDPRQIFQLQRQELLKLEAEEAALQRAFLAARASVRDRKHGAGQFTEELAQVRERLRPLTRQLSAIDISQIDPEDERGMREYGELSLQVTSLQEREEELVQMIANRKQAVRDILEDLQRNSRELQAARQRMKPMQISEEARREAEADIRAARRRRKNQERRDREQPARDYAAQYRRSQQAQLTRQAAESAYAEDPAFSGTPEFAKEQLRALHQERRQLLKERAEARRQGITGGTTDTLDERLAENKGKLDAAQAAHARHMQEREQQAEAKRQAQAAKRKAEREAARPQETLERTLRSAEAARVQAESDSTAYLGDVGLGDRLDQAKRVLDSLQKERRKLIDATELARQYGLKLDMQTVNRQLAANEPQLEAARREVARHQEAAEAARRAAREGKQPQAELERTLRQAAKSRLKAGAAEEAFQSDPMLRNTLDQARQVLRALEQERRSLFEAMELARQYGLQLDRKTLDQQLSENARMLEAAQREVGRLGGSSGRRIVDERASAQFIDRNMDPEHRVPLMTQMQRGDGSFEQTGWQATRNRAFGALPVNVGTGDNYLGTRTKEARRELQDAKELLDLAEGLRERQEKLAKDQQELNEQEWVPDLSRRRKTARNAQRARRLAEEELEALTQAQPKLVAEAMRMENELLTLQQRSASQEAILRKQHERDAVASAEREAQRRIQIKQDEVQRLRQLERQAAVASQLETQQKRRSNLFGFANRMNTFMQYYVLGQAAWQGQRMVAEGLQHSYERENALTGLRLSTPTHSPFSPEHLDIVKKIARVYSVEYLKPQAEIVNLLAAQYRLTDQQADSASRLKSAWEGMLPTLKFATVAQIDGVEALENWKAAAAGLGLEMNQLEPVMGKVLALAKQMPEGIQDLGAGHQSGAKSLMETAAQFGGGARGFGFSTNQVLAFAKTLSDYSIKTGQRIGEDMNRLVFNMMSAIPKLAQREGIRIDVGTDRAGEQLIEALPRLAQLAQQGVNLQIPPDASALLQTLGRADFLADLKEALRLAESAGADTLDRDFQMRMEQASSKVERSKYAWQAFQTVIGERLIPIVIRGAEVLERMASWVERNEKGIRRFLAVVLQLLAAIAAWKVINLAIDGFSLLTTAISTAGGGLAGFLAVLGRGAAQGLLVASVLALVSGMIARVGRDMKKLAQDAEMTKLRAEHGDKVVSLNALEQLRQSSFRGPTGSQANPLEKARMWSADSLWTTPRFAWAGSPLGSGNSAYEKAALDSLLAEIRSEGAEGAFGGAEPTLGQLMTSGKIRGLIDAAIAREVGSKVFREMRARGGDPSAHPELKELYDLLAQMSHRHPEFGRAGWRSPVGVDRLTPAQQQRLSQLVQKFRQDIPEMRFEESDWLTNMQYGLRQMFNVNTGKDSPLRQMMDEIQTYFANLGPGAGYAMPMPELTPQLVGTAFDVKVDAWQKRVEAFRAALQSLKTDQDLYTHRTELTRLQVDLLAQSEQHLNSIYQGRDMPTEALNRRIRLMEQQVALQRTLMVQLKEESRYLDAQKFRANLMEAATPNLESISGEAIAAGLARIGGGFKPGTVTPGLGNLNLIQGNQQTLLEMLFGLPANWKPSAGGAFGASRDGGKRTHAGWDMPNREVTFPFSAQVRDWGRPGGKGGSFVRLYVPELEKEFKFQHQEISPEMERLLRSGTVQPGQLRLRAAQSPGRDAGSSWTGPHHHVEVFDGQGRRLDPSQVMRSPVGSMLALGPSGLGAAPLAPEAMGRDLFGMSTTGTVKEPVGPPAPSEAERRLNLRMLEEVARRQREWLRRNPPPQSSEMRTGTQAAGYGESLRQLFRQQSAEEYERQRQQAFAEIDREVRAAHASRKTEVAVQRTAPKPGVGGPGVAVPPRRTDLPEMRQDVYASPIVPPEMPGVDRRFLQALSPYATYFAQNSRTGVDVNDPRFPIAPGKRASLQQLRAAYAWFENQFTTRASESGKYQGMFQFDKATLEEVMGPGTWEKYRSDRNFQVQAFDKLVLRDLSQAVGGDMSRLTPELFWKTMSRRFPATSTTKRPQVEKLLGALTANRFGMGVIPGSGVDVDPNLTVDDLGTQIGLSEAYRKKLQQAFDPIQRDKWERIIDWNVQRSQTRAQLRSPYGELRTPSGQTFSPVLSGDVKEASIYREQIQLQRDVQMYLLSLDKESAEKRLQILQTEQAIAEQYVRMMDLVTERELKPFRQYMSALEEGFRKQDLLLEWSSRTHAAADRLYALQGEDDSVLRLRRTSLGQRMEGTLRRYHETASELARWEQVFERVHGLQFQLRQSDVDWMRPFQFEQEAGGVIDNAAQALVETVRGAFGVEWPEAGSAARDAWVAQGVHDQYRLLTEQFLRVTGFDRLVGEGGFVSTYRDDFRQAGLGNLLDTIERQGYVTPTDWNSLMQIEGLEALPQRLRHWLDQSEAELSQFAQEWSHLTERLFDYRHTRRMEQLADAFERVQQTGEMARQVAESVGVQWERTPGYLVQTATEVAELQNQLLALTERLRQTGDAAVKHAEKWWSEFAKMPEIDPETGKPYNEGKWLLQMQAQFGPQPLRPEDLRQRHRDALQAFDRTQTDLRFRMLDPTRVRNEDADFLRDLQLARLAYVRDAHLASQNRMPGAAGREALENYLGQLERNAASVLSHWEEELLRNQETLAAWDHAIQFWTEELNKLAENDQRRAEISAGLAELEAGREQVLMRGLDVQERYQRSQSDLLRLQELQLRNEEVRFQQDLVRDAVTDLALARVGPSSEEARGMSGERVLLSRLGGFFGQLGSRMYEQQMETLIDRFLTDVFRQQGLEAELSPEVRAQVTAITENTEALKAFTDAVRQVEEPSTLAERTPSEWALPQLSGAAGVVGAAALATVGLRLPWERPVSQRSTEEVLARGMAEGMTLFQKDQEQGGKHGVAALRAGLSLSDPANRPPARTPGPNGFLQNPNLKSGLAAAGGLYGAWSAGQASGTGFMGAAMGAAQGAFMMGPGLAAALGVSGPVGMAIGGMVGLLGSLFGSSQEQTEIQRRIFNQMPRRSDILYAASVYLPQSAYYGGRFSRFEVAVNLHGVTVTSAQHAEQVGQVVGDTLAPVLKSQMARGPVSRRGD